MSQNDESETLTTLQKAKRIWHVEARKTGTNHHKYALVNEVTEDDAKAAMVKGFGKEWESVKVRDYMEMQAESTQSFLKWLWGDT